MNAWVKHVEKALAVAARAPGEAAAPITQAEELVRDSLAELKAALTGNPR